VFQFFYFVLIYSILIFIWSYILVNTKKDDKINQSFLIFLGVVLIWMTLDASSSLSIQNSVLNFIVKSLYFISMLNMAVAFLNFVYQLVNRKYDLLFYLSLFLNTATIILRYFYPLSFSNPNFWRIESVFIATLMAVIFSVPMIVAIYMVIRYLHTTQKALVKSQLKFTWIGVSIATVISILSEYVLPVLLKTPSRISLMYIAILIFILFLFFAIIKFKFLNITIETLYENLFLYSNEGILLIDRNMNILNINHTAKNILKNFRADEKMKINSFIKEYCFDEDYFQFEATMQVDDELHYIILSQSPIQSSDRTPSKILHITDVTKNHVALLREKELLIERSVIDDLTGLYNKNYFLENYMNTSTTNKRNLQLIFIDIDDFKNINDSYGHLAGDEVIRAVATGVRDSIRNNEIAIRYGGDEFLIILESINQADAKMIAERIQANVSKAKFNMEMKSIKITLSIGLHNGNETMTDLLAKADKAMYFSKTHGKNKVTVFTKGT